MSALEVQHRIVSQSIFPPTPCSRQKTVNNHTNIPLQSGLSAMRDKRRFSDAELHLCPVLLAISNGWELTLPSRGKRLTERTVPSPYHLDKTPDGPLLSYDESRHRPPRSHFCLMNELWSCSQSRGSHEEYTIVWPTVWADHGASPTWTLHLSVTSGWSLRVSQVPERVGHAPCWWEYE